MGCVPEGKLSYEGESYALVYTQAWSSGDLVVQVIPRLAPRFGCDLHN